MIAPALDCQIMAFRTSISSRFQEASSCMARSVSGSRWRLLMSFPGRSLPERTVPSQLLLCDGSSSAAPSKRTVDAHRLRTPAAGDAARIGETDFKAPALPHFKTDARQMPLADHPADAGQFRNLL